jgi:hypothetical protein
MSRWLRVAGFRLRDLREAGAGQLGVSIVTLGHF